MKRTADQLISGHLIYVQSSEDLASAWAKMQSNDVRHLIVVNEKNDLVGVLSDRDCLKAVHSQSYFNQRGRAVEITFPQNVFVEEYMRAPVKLVEYDTPTYEIAELMNESKISSVVVRSAGRVIGILTEYDILKDYIDIMKPKSSL